MMRNRRSSTSSGRQSKAVKEIANDPDLDDHLDEDVYVWQGSSFSSIASSVTAPPSQTASFYRKVLGNYSDDTFDYGGSSVGGSTLGSHDGDSLSNDGSSRTSDSEKAKKKKKKGRGIKKGVRKFFGGKSSTIKEGPEEDEEDESSAQRQQRRPRRRLSLFGNSTSDSGDNFSTDSGDDLFYKSAEDSNDDDDDENLQASRDTLDLGYEEAAPTTAVENGARTARRRSSLGKVFSKKEKTSDLGYEEAAPTVSTNRRRRGSIGSIFSRKEETPKEKDLGYGDGAPTTASKKTQRRGSLTSMFSKAEDIPAENRSTGNGKVKRRGSIGTMFSKKEDIAGEETKEPEMPRGKTKRRSSLGGIFSKKEEIPRTKEDRNSSLKSSGTGRSKSPKSLTRDSSRSASPLGFSEHTDDSSLPLNSLADMTLHTTKTNEKTKEKTKEKHKAKKSRGRRRSLTGAMSVSSNTTNSTKQEIHWIVNQERIARGMVPFERSVLLDQMAKSMANELANGRPPTPSQFHGNVGKGDSLKNIHATIMADRSGISRKNILSTRFTEFGMALTRTRDGAFYMVQLFTD